MYAIVEIGSHQYKVENGKSLYVNRLDSSVGDEIMLDNVLLVDDESKVEIGTPILENANIKATILRHLKADKEIVFKKKRRKGYRVKRGHRQYITEIAINNIELK